MNYDCDYDCDCDYIFDIDMFRRTIFNTRMNTNWMIEIMRCEMQDDFHASCEDPIGHLNQGIQIPTLQFSPIDTC